MSKRFGRQQKRKMREQIECLNRKLKFIERDTGSTVTAARQIIKAVRDVCPHSSLIERSRVSQWQYRMESQFLTSSYIAAENLPERPIDIRKIDLYDLEVLFKQYPFEKMVHFDAVFSDDKGIYSRSGYRMSKEALVYTPIDMIVRSLVEHLRKDMRNRGEA